MGISEEHKNIIFSKYIDRTQPENGKHWNVNRKNIVQLKEKEEEKECIKGVHCYNCKHFRRVKTEYSFGLFHDEKEREYFYCAKEVECVGYEEGER